MSKTLRYKKIKTGYGLDLAGEHKAVVKAVWSGRSVKYEPLSDMPGVIPRVEADVERGKAVSAGVVRTGHSVSRWLDAPLKSLAKTRQVLPALLDVQLPFPLEQTLSHFPVIEKTEDGRVRALAVAAREQTLEDELEHGRALGVSPVYMDHEGLALWEQSLEEFPVELNTFRVVVYLGSESSVMVLGRGRNYFNAHGSRIGCAENPPESPRWQEFKSKLQRTLSVEVKGLVDQTVRWFWTGPGAENSDLIAQLEKDNPYHRSIYYQIAGDPAHFLARGLAARSLMENTMSCNFREGPWAHPQTRKRNTIRQTSMALSLAAALLLLLGVNAGWLKLLDLRSQKLQSALVERAQALAPGIRIQPGQEVQTVTSMQRQKAKTRDPFKKAFEPSLNAMLTELMKRAHEKNLILESCTLNEGLVNVRGTSPAWEDCEILTEFLVGLGYKISPPTRKNDASGQKTYFSFKGERRYET